MRSDELRETSRGISANSNQIVSGYNPVIGPFSKSFAVPGTDKTGIYRLCAYMYTVADSSIPIVSQQYTLARGRQAPAQCAVPVGAAGTGFSAVRAWSWTHADLRGRQGQLPPRRGPVIAGGVIRLSVQAKSKHAVSCYRVNILASQGPAGAGAASPRAMKRWRLRRRGTDGRHRIAARRRYFTPGKPAVKGWLPCRSLAAQLRRHPPTRRARRGGRSRADPSGGIPLRAEQRLKRMSTASTPFFTSDLSAKEYALAQASGLKPIAQVMGSSVVHPARLGGGQGAVLHRGDPRALGAVEHGTRPRVLSLGAEAAWLVQTA